MKPRTCLLLVVFFLHQPLTAHAWYDKVHSYLVKLAAQIVEQKDKVSGQRLYEELYTNEFLLQMGRGAWREDHDPSVAGNARAMRHYYDPDATIDPRTRPTQGVAYYSHYRLWAALEPGTEVTPPPGGFYEGAMRWALDGGSTPGNPFHWNGAIGAHGSGTVQAKTEAYFRLGHVLHLLGDASEPDHAANVPHAASGKYVPDDLEGPLADKTLGVLQHLAQIVPEPGRSIMKDALPERFLAQGEPMVRKEIADFLKAQLESRYGNRPVRLIGLEGLMEDTIAPSLVEEFFLAHERGKVPPRVAGLPVLSLGGAPVPPHDEFQKFFDELARSAKRRQRDSGRPLAVGCDHLRRYVLPFVDKKLESYLAQTPFWPVAITITRGPTKAAIMRYLENCELLNEPLYFIPTINERDPKSFRPYVALGEPLLREATGYLAGLMMHFHDVVNEPPFVQEVKVSQSDTRYYAGSWEEMTADIPNGRTEEPYYDLKNPEVPKSYKSLVGRTLVQKTDTFLHSGGPARIEITFGPVAKWRQVEIKEQIDPASVKVFVDGKKVEGAMTGENKWAGGFVPKLGKDQPDRTFRIAIEAKDLHRHHPRTGLPAKGYELDSYPATVAHASPEPPAYAWQGYERGIDRNHSFFVTQREGDDREEPQPPPPKPKPKTGINEVQKAWEGSWILVSNHTGGRAKGVSLQSRLEVAFDNGAAKVTFGRAACTVVSISPQTLVIKYTGGGNRVTATLDRVGKGVKGAFEGVHEQSGEGIVGTFEDLMSQLQRGAKKP